MKRIWLFMLVFNAAPHLFAQAENPVVDEVPLPGEVVTALAENYRIGRLEWDTGGVATLRHFRKTGTSTRDEVLTEIIRRTAGEADDDGSLASYCVFDEDGPMTTNFHRCSRWLLQHRHHRQAIPWLRSMASGEGDFEDHVSVIYEFIRQRAGLDYNEVSVVQNIWSVDVMASVIFAADQKTIFYLVYDFGA